MTHQKMLRHDANAKIQQTETRIPFVAEDRDFYDNLRDTISVDCGCDLDGPGHHCGQATL